MKLVTFIQDDKPVLGVKTVRGILDAAAAARLTSSQGWEKWTPLSIMEVIEGGAEAVDLLRRLAEKSLALPGTSGVFLDEAELTFGPCVPEPNKIICVGLNYRKHAEETNAQIPPSPILFNKFNNALTGHGSDVALPRVSSKVDYEAELVIVIGKHVKDVAKEEALDYVFGYCAANDLSARDLQMRTQQWLLGKSCDGFCPLGPYLVTADEVGNPNDLAIQCAVNGDVRQSSNTKDMIFYCDEIVSYISRHMTLVPGDLILTGTPEGVVLGYPVEKQAWLKDGDVVTVDIEKLGSLTNRMVSASS